MKEERFSIKSNQGYNISCVKRLPDEYVKLDKIIIACHGFCGSKDSGAIEMLAMSLTKYNIGVFSMDFPGHGKSETDGKDFRVENCIDDLNTFEKYIVNEYPNTEIGFFSTSYGAYTTLLKLARDYEKESIENKYKKIVLRCPAINMKGSFVDDILEGKLEEFLAAGVQECGYKRMIDIYKEYYEDLVENDVFEKYHAKQNILIIHGTADTTAPIIHSRRFKQDNEPYVKIIEIEGAGHRFLENNALEKVIEYATEYILAE